MGSAPCQSRIFIQLMPERWGFSVPFKNADGKRYVQVGDSGGDTWFLVPIEHKPDWYAKLQFILDALNLKETADKLAPTAVKKLSE